VFGMIVTLSAFNTACTSGGDKEAEEVLEDASDDVVDETGDVAEDAMSDAAEDAASVGEDIGEIPTDDPAEAAAEAEAAIGGSAARPATPTGPKVTRYVKTFAVNIRSAPSKQAPIVGHLARGH